MAGMITHSWNGTILTITSDSGTSSMDLKGGSGDIGPRGPQGPAGVIINPDGTIDYNGYATETYVDQKIAEVEMSDANLENYYTKEETLALIPDTNDFATKTYVDNAIAGIEFPETDLTGYATETYVDEAIAAIDIPETDLTDYATKEYVDNAIANSGGGTGGDVDLSNYYTKNEVDALIPDVSGFITMSAIEAKGYQTADQVQTAINDALTALDGDEVSY